MDKQEIMKAILAVKLLEMQKDVEFIHDQFYGQNIIAEPLTSQIKSLLNELINNLLLKR
jgi:hypothetical protein